MQPLNKAQDWYVFFTWENSGELGSERMHTEEAAQSIAAWHEREEGKTVVVFSASELRERLFSHR